MHSKTTKHTVISGIHWNFFTQEIKIVEKSIILYCVKLSVIIYSNDLHNEIDRAYSLLSPTFGDAVALWVGIRIKRLLKVAEMKILENWKTKKHSE